MSNYYQTIKERLVNLLSLSSDKMSESEAIENIIEGSEFRGTKLWVLICSIFIASLGLNQNSTAVIIGAMLISPLMGPIMGMGLGFGIEDANLIRRCAKNLGIATLFSLLTSCIFFLISPLNDARSELLARTQPMIWDVLIAFFGGLAGIITTCSKNKGNILAGVAIATALMPPLCTAGYGLATLQFNFLLGAFYLFIINCVYIGFATYLGVLLMKLNKVGKIRTKHFKLWSILTLVIVVIPSIFTTVNIIHEGFTEAHIREFIHDEFGTLEETELLKYKNNKGDSIDVIEVSIIGKPLSEQEIELKQAKMGGYNLKRHLLRVVQNGEVETSEHSIRRQSVIIDGVIRTLQDQILQLHRENDSLRNANLLLKQSIGESQLSDSTTISVQ